MVSLPTQRLLLLALLGAHLLPAEAQELATAGPTVTWVSEPVEPGAPALLAVVGMANATVIETRQGKAGAWATAEKSGVTQYGCVITVPTSYALGTFEIRADSGAPFAANVARPWFHFGDGGSFSSPGGWVRIVGDAIGISPLSASSVLRLTPAGSATTTGVVAASAAPQDIPARKSSDGDGLGAKSTRWHAFFDLPSSIATGQYTISISNGEGSPFTPMCTFIDPQTPCLSALNVSHSHVFKTDIFTVNATQPGVGRDATAAVSAAINAATKNGGGVVFFPTGQYFIKTALVVPSPPNIHVIN